MRRPKVIITKTGRAIRQDSPRPKVYTSPSAAMITQVRKYLFGKDENRLAKRIIALVQENHRLGGARDGFIYEGVYYSDLITRAKSKGQRGSMMPELRTQMLDYLEDTKQVNQDRENVEQILSLVLLTCHTKQDVRDALPEELVPLIPFLQGYQRTREEGWNLKTEREQRQYAKYRPLIDIYLVARLMI